MNDETILSLIYESENFFLNQEIINGDNIIDIIDRLRKDFPPLKITLKLSNEKEMIDITLYDSVMTNSI